MTLWLICMLKVPNWITQSIRYRVICYFHLSPLIMNKFANLTRYNKKEKPMLILFSTGSRGINWFVMSTQYFNDMHRQWQKKIFFHVVFTSSVMRMFMNGNFKRKLRHEIELRDYHICQYNCDSLSNIHEYGQTLNVLLKWLFYYKKLFTNINYGS